MKKYADINKRFTAIISDYMANGYWINTSTMGGSQGERAKVDLTDGEEVIRVMISSFNDWNNNTQGFEIIVGRAVEGRLSPDSADDYDTVWNEHLEVLSTERFYTLNHRRCKQEKVFGTLEQATEVAEKQIQRYHNRDTQKTIEFNNPEALYIARKYLLNNNLYKRVNIKYLTVCKKFYKTHVSYVVEYNGNPFILL